MRVFDRLNIFDGELKINFIPSPESLGLLFFKAENIG